MKEKNTAKRLFSVLWIYLLCAALTAILIPLPQKESSGELWRQYEARLDTVAAQERVMTIEDSDSALLLRLQLIESARRDLIFSTFDLRADESGQDVMSALCAAAERGVQVRMIVDGLNGFLHLQGDATLRALAASENVEVRFYDPVDLLRPWKLNYRLHDKYLIADGERYILGGRNTSDLFLGSYQEKRNIDRDALVVSNGSENSSVRQLAAYFESVWSQPENRTIKGRASEKTGALHERYESLRENKSPELWDTLCRLMEQGDDVLLQTPYLICNRAMYGDLAHLAGERQVRILTNAVETGANPSGCADYLIEKRTILSCGLDVYEAVSGQSLHTKTILIGNNLSIVGSFNADMRSAYLDTELMLVIESESFNDVLRQAEAPYIARSRLVLHDGSTACGAQFEETALPPLKRALYRVLSVALRPVRHLL